MYVFRKAYHLEKYITEEHFEKMGRIVVMLALLYLYFNVNEYLVPAFKMKKPEEAHLRNYSPVNMLLSSGLQFHGNGNTNFYCYF